MKIDAEPMLIWMVEVCGKCGYEITGLPDSVSLCPECGSRIGRLAPEVNPSFRQTLLPMIIPTASLAAVSSMLGLVARHTTYDALGGYACVLGMLVGLVAGAGMPPVIATNQCLNPDRRGRRLRPMEAVFFCVIGWACNAAILWISSAVAAQFVTIHGIC